MRLTHIIVAAVALAAMASCSTPRTPLTYFTDIDSVGLNATVAQGEYLTRIVPDDELLITITSQNPEATAAYNLPLSNPAVNSQLTKATTPQQMTYLVDSKGDITMPVIGTLHVGGLTTEQVRNLVTEKVSADVDDPTVIVKMVNFHVNVAGEVRTPGVVNVTRERFSVLDALSSAGDLTEYGERSNVLLVREENGKRTAHRINLNSSDILTSPYFYVQQNDYIYVTPNKIRQDNSKYNQINAFKLSVISTIVSACSIVASLVIALAIK